ncbi:hypothetical protein HDU97_001610 [Phlyctochytrium planicorne]|nr:hypothetical protein HDU97_001610 [Phlyctochytrium planicorne]
MVFGFGKPAGFTADSLPNLDGKVVIITGASAGLGKTSALELAKKGAHVVMAVRTIKKGQDVADDIKKAVPGAKIDVMELDLANLASVKKFANEYQARGLPIHCLMNNAGIMAIPTFTLSADNIEIQLASNHVGHHYLTSLLLPIIESTSASGPVTIVNLSSMGHMYTTPNGIDFDNINNPKTYNSFAYYGQSKLANILFTKELQRRVDAKNPNNQIYVNCLHPGVVNTDLANKSVIPQFLVSMFSGFVTPVTEGCLTQLYCSFSPEIVEKKFKGEYFVPTAKLAKPSAYGLDDGLAKKLWEWTDSVIAEKGFQEAKL